MPASFFYNVCIYVVIDFCKLKYESVLLLTHFEAEERDVF